MSQVAFRPFSEHVRESWHLYTRYFWQYIGMMLVPLVGIIPLIIAITIAVALYFIPVQAAASPLMIALLVTVTLLGIAAFIYIAAWGQAGLLLQVIHRANNAPKSFKETLREARPTVLSLIWAGILNVIIVIIGFVLLIIPGFVAIVYLLFVQWIVVTGEKSGWEALKRSYRLVRGNFWPVALRGLGVFILMGAIVGTPQQFMTEGTWAFNMYEGSINILSLIFTPLLTIYFYQLYRDISKQAN